MIEEKVRMAEEENPRRGWRRGAESGSAEPGHTHKTRTQTNNPHTHTCPKPHSSTARRPPPSPPSLFTTGTPALGDGEKAREARPAGVASRM